MGEPISPEDERALVDLRESLLRSRPPALGPDQGDEALQWHKVIASAVQRASGLHGSGHGETKHWIQYVTSFFPEGRNSEADALTLWDGWRCSLLKEDHPVVPVLHGQSHAHWQRDEAGRPYLNLEDMWADYEYSIGRFIEHLREHANRREIALDRWRKTTWSVKPVTLFEQLTGATSASASMATSATVMSPSEDWLGKLE